VRTIAGPPEGHSAGRWPADVYNLALIAGPAEEWSPVKAELLSTVPPARGGLVAPLSAPPGTDRSARSHAAT